MIAIGGSAAVVMATARPAVCLPRKYVRDRQINERVPEERNGGLRPQEPLHGAA